jgi:hypothetical protein
MGLFGTLCINDTQQGSMEYHYTECLNDECHYAECHNAECHHAECHNAECHYAECRSDVYVTSRHFNPSLIFESKARANQSKFLW